MVNHTHYYYNSIYQKTYQTVENLINNGYAFFCTGGVRGFDTLYADKNKAFKVIYTQEAYGRCCSYKRDRQLVYRSSLCIAYQYKNSGGTAYTTKYAVKNGLKVINIS